MKSNKLKKYRYNSQLIDAWLTNSLPESGGYYTGSSTYLECNDSCLWAGRDQEFLLAVKNKSHGETVAILVRPVSDIPFTGAVHDSVAMVAGSFTEHRTVLNFLPKESRKDKWTVYTHFDSPPTGIPTILVPKLTEDMETRELVSLLPSILSYYDKAFEKHSAARKRSHPNRLLGYWFGGFYDEDRFTETTNRVRKTFNALNIPWKQEWSDMATLRAAKLRLAA